MNTRSIDCSLRAYAADFAKEFNQCLRANPVWVNEGGEASCLVSAALETLKNMKTQCSGSKDRLDCTPQGYLDAVIEELDPVQKIMKIGFGKVESSLAQAFNKHVPGILPPPAEVAYVMASSCAVGGAIGAVGGAIATPLVPLLGAGFGLVEGCIAGTKVGMGIYGLWNVIVKVGGVYKASILTIDTFKRHSNGCEANTMAILQRPIQAASAPSPITKNNTSLPLPSSASSKIPIQGAAVAIPKKQQLSNPISQNAPLQIRSQVPTSFPVVPAAAPAFHWIDMEAAAQKIVDFAGDITGVKSVVQEATDLKELYLNIFSNPENAPELLLSHLYKGPKEIFQRVLDAPKNFYNSGEAFLADPSLMGAIGLVSGALSIIALANEVLPILHLISDELINNPLKAPVNIPKGLVQLTSNKIKALHLLAQDFVKNPLKAGEHLVKGVIKSPELLYHNVKQLLGINKHKAKKRRRRLEAAMQQQAAEIEQQMIAAENRAIEQLTRAICACYEVAITQWMLRPEVKIQDYFTTLHADWKRAVATIQFDQNFIQFIVTIQKQLELGDFPEACRLSPLAHNPEPYAPPVMAYALRDLAIETLRLQGAMAATERAMQADQLAGANLTTAAAAFHLSNTNAQNYLAANADKIRQGLIAIRKAKLQTN